MKGIYLASILGVASMMGANASAADWSDTSMGISYGSRYEEPGINGDIAKTVFNLAHVSGYKYGTNFFNVEFLKSNQVDPSSGAGNTDGAIEVYAVYRHQLSMAAATGRSMAFGPVKDVGLTAGIDLGTKNTGFGSRPIKTVLGPSLDFAVDNGFFNVGLFWYHETNNNGIVGRSVNFDSTYQLSSAWSKGFELGLPAKFTGYLTHTGPKGKNGFGVETTSSTVAHAMLMFDVGSLAGKKGNVYAGFGVDHFTNKYGEKGVHQTTPVVQLEVHF